MMKYVAPLLVLLSFTDPKGDLVWVERQEVSTVQRAVNCDEHAETKITTLTGVVCVRERLEEALGILETQHDSAGRFRGVSRN